MANIPEGHIAFEEMPAGLVPPGFNDEVPLLMYLTEQLADEVRSGVRCHRCAAPFTAPLGRDRIQEWKDTDQRYCTENLSQAYILIMTMHCPFCGIENTEEMKRLSDIAYRFQRRGEVYSDDISDAEMDEVVPFAPAPTADQLGD